MTNMEIDGAMERFSIKVIGDYDKDDVFEKATINDMLVRFASSYTDTFSQGEIVADIKQKKGHHNEGRYRGIPLAYVKLRFSTDKGMFVAGKENWGVGTALNDSIHILNSQIREQLHKHPPRIKETGESLFGAET